MSNQETTVAQGSNQIETARLMTLKQAVRLEATGLKHSSGKSMRKVACRLLGLRLSTKHDDVIGALAKEIEKRLKQQAATSAHVGWQASLEFDGKLCTDRMHADAAAALLGWAVEEEIAAEHGLWMVTVSDATLAQLGSEGYVELTNDEVRDGYKARGEIETP